MSDENENNDSNGIANLRAQYEAQQKELKAANERLAAFDAKERQATVSGLLKAKGVPEAAASLYTSDDVSEDAVGKWIEQHSAVFGVQAQQQQQDQNATDAARAAAASFGNASSAQGDPAPGKVLGDPAEMLHAIQTLPYDELVKLGYMPKDQGQLFNSGRR